jgi:hypothetical protein
MRSTGSIAWIVYAGVAAMLLLLAAGWFLAPEVPPIAPAAVLVGYVIIARVSVSVIGSVDASPRVLLVTSGLGAASAGVLIWSDVIQYFGHTANNAIMVAVVLRVRAERISASRPILPHRGHLR